MCFAKATVFKIVLPVILLLSPLLGTVAKVEAAPAYAVALNTYGSLPVVVLNLTLSPININVSTNSPEYTNTILPLAIGLPGVYYAQNNGTTATFNNIVNPSTPVNGTTSASLMPPLTPAPTADSNPVTNNQWMSLFTVFPSWSMGRNFNHVQFVFFDTLNPSYGAAAVPGNYTLQNGYPSSNPKNANASNVSAMGLNAGTPVATSINLNLLAQAEATYSININSAGGLTSGSVAMPSNGLSIMKAMHSVLNIATDIASCVSGDALAISDFIAGIPATINGIVTDISNNNQSTNVNIATDNTAPSNTSAVNVTTTTPYPAKTAGILVSASATFKDTNGEMLSYYMGSPQNPFVPDSQSVIYGVSTMSVPYLPLEQQNYIAVTTWRQSPNLNTGSVLPNSADTLFVTVLNEGVYTANQVQQYINNPPTSQTAGLLPYKPTKAQAQDTFKILGILTALSKNHPQDAKTMIDLFGMHGKYGAIKKDPNALRSLNVELKTIFEKHKQELPVIEQYLTKLAQKK